MRLLIILDKVHIYNFYKRKRKNDFYPCHETSLTWLGKSYRHTCIYVFTHIDLDIEMYAKYMSMSVYVCMYICVHQLLDTYTHIVVFVCRPFAVVTFYDQSKKKWVVTDANKGSELELMHWHSFHFLSRFTQFYVSVLYNRRAVCVRGLRSFENRLLHGVDDVEC